VIKIVQFLKKKFPDIFSELEFETLLKEVEKEKQELSALTTERDLLMLPETVGNLIQNHIAATKINSEFYKNHPEFKGKEDVVASVIEMVEGENPLMEYKDLIQIAIPKIKERIKNMEGIDMTAPATVDRNFSNGEI